MESARGDAILTCVMRRLFPAIFIFFAAFSAACGPTESPSLRGEFGIRAIFSSTEPIRPEEGYVPEFQTHFATGTTVVYSYVFLENAQTMTGSFPVRLRWFYPNDFRPPMAQHIVELEPGQEVAQFEIHNESGMQPGPYMLIARSGRDQSNFTASGSVRYFVGMTEEEARVFLEEEEEYRRQREEERIRREAEEQERIEREGTGSLLLPEDMIMGNEQDALLSPTLIGGEEADE